jgi:hypothetical protein
VREKERKGKEGEKQKEGGQVGTVGRYSIVNERERECVCVCE